MGRGKQAAENGSGNQQADIQRTPVKSAIAPVLRLTQELERHKSEREQGAFRQPRITCCCTTPLGDLIAANRASAKTEAA